MSQDTVVIPNVAGATFRADINLAFLALISQNSGASAPAIMYPYMVWADTTTGILKQRNAANTAWINLWNMALGAPYGSISQNFATNILTTKSIIFSANYTGSFTGAVATVTDVYTNVGSVVKILCYAAENGVNNTSFGEWIAVYSVTGWAINLISQAIKGNTYGTAVLTFSGNNLQITNVAGAAFGTWKISFQSLV